MHRLVIVRHGKAQRESPSGHDTDRDLKPRGERQAQWLGETLGAETPQIGRIVASSAVRARRTAEILAGAIGLGVEYDDRLLVDRPLVALADLLEEAIEDGSWGDGALALVGHNMQLDDAIGLLTSGFGATGPGLRTGMAAIMDIDPAGIVGSARNLRLLRLDEDD